MFDFKIQLKNILRESHIIQHLQYRFRRQNNTNNVLEDVYDGSMYKEMSQLRRMFYLEFIIYI